MMSLLTIILLTTKPAAVSFTTQCSTLLLLLMLAALKSGMLLMVLFKVFSVTAHLKTSLACVWITGAVSSSLVIKVAESTASTLRMELE